MTVSTPRAALRLGPVALFGLAYMAPMIVLGTFGELTTDSGNAAPTAYLLALVAMLFTARSYGRMAREFPVAGSAYSYVRRTMNAHLGFLVGWVVLLDYFFLPMVTWLIGASFLAEEFPGVPSWLWVVAFVVVTTVVNVAGLKLAANVNLLLMLMQILVLAFFVVNCLRFVGASGAPVLSAAPFGNPATTVAAVAAGAALAAYSFLGFDAITTLTEETHDARRTIPRAILLVTLVGGTIYVVTAYATQLAALHVPGLPTASAASGIAAAAGGRLLAAVFLAGLIVTQFASGIASQASAARLLYAMGRDGVLPTRVFGYLHPKLGTPVINIALVGLVGLVGITLSVTESTAFINFGAFTAFTFVNLCVLALAVRNRALTGARNLLVNGALPVIGAAVCVWLLTQLDVAALTIGPIWLVLGIGYLVWLTRLFRRRPPELSAA